MITKRMIDEMDADFAKDREEILKIAKEEGISYEEIVEFENQCTYDTAKLLKKMDQAGLFAKDNERHGEV